jgi:Cys-tRNA(Pro)/Cys-tRNA(Cys) deacylase
MTTSTPVTRALDALAIPYRVFVHPGPIANLQQAAQERGQLPEQVVRSLLFRLAKDEFVMVLIAGPKQVSWKALRSYFGQSRLTTATEEEVLAVTGYLHGAVSPFGLLQPVRILVDHSVLAPAEISIGSGVRGTTIILKTADLIKALGKVETGDFCESCDSNQSNPQLSNSA